MRENTPSLKPCRSCRYQGTEADSKERCTEKSDKGLSLLSSLSQYHDNSDNNDTDNDNRFSRVEHTETSKNYDHDNNDTVIEKSKKEAIPVGK